MQLRSRRERRREHQSMRAVTYTYIHIRDISLQIRDISLSTDLAGHDAVQQRGHQHATPAGVLTGICGLGYRPCPRAVSALRGGTTCTERVYSVLLSALFPPPSRFVSRVPSLFRACRAGYLIALRTSRSLCFFRAKSRARGIKDAFPDNRRIGNK